MFVWFFFIFSEFWVCTNVGSILLPGFFRSSSVFVWFLKFVSEFWARTSFGSVRLPGFFRISLVFVWFFKFLSEFLLSTNFGSVRLLSLFQNCFRVCLVFWNRFRILGLYKLWLCSTSGFGPEFLWCLFGFYFFYKSYFLCYICHVLFFSVLFWHVLFGHETAWSADFFIVAVLNKFRGIWK